MITTADLVEDLRARPQDRALFRAAMRAALIRHAALCREEAQAMELEEDAAELYAEAHAAMCRALDWEA